MVGGRAVRLLVAQSTGGPSGVLRPMVTASVAAAVPISVAIILCARFANSAALFLIAFGIINLCGIPWAAFQWGIVMVASNLIYYHSDIISARSIFIPRSL